MSNGVGKRDELNDGGRVRDKERGNQNKREEGMVVRIRGRDGGREVMIEQS